MWKNSKILIFLGGTLAIFNKLFTQKPEQIYVEFFFRETPNQIFRKTLRGGDIFCFENLNNNILKIISRNP